MTIAWGLEQPAIPPAVAARLEADIPELIAEIVQSIGEAQPEYAAYLDQESADVVDLAGQALRLLLAAAGGADLADGLPHATFEDIGRLEFDSGRSLRDLLAAYRTGARVAWRHVARTSIEQGAGAELLAALAEAVFAFVDALSDATARGYAQAQLQAGAERERRRFALAGLLVAGDPAAADLAAADGWKLPASLALALVPDRGREAALRLAERLGPRALPVVRPDDRAGVLIADLDAPGARRLVASRLRGSHAVVGLAGPVGGLAPRIGSVESALYLVGQGALPDSDPLFVPDHLADLVVVADPVLAHEIAGRRLAPLDGLPDRTRDRLAETLRAWLDNLGDRRATAAALNVHPQTVRYRMDQLSRLFGADLGGPQVRFELALALRADRLASR
jgi:hypothetical protein